MTNTYVTNATWAPAEQTSELDFCLSSPDAPSSLCLDGIPLPEVRETAPAGTMNIPAGAQVIDAKGKVLLPALFDLHAQIEIPGRSKRECIMRAGQAAIQGGVWGMLVMPSAAFCFDNAATLDSFHEIKRLTLSMKRLPEDSWDIIKDPNKV